MKTLAMLTALWAASPSATLTYYAPYGAEDDGAAHSMTQWSANQTAYLAVDDGNLREGPNADAKVVTTLPLGTPAKVIRAAGERTKIGLRHDRWYEVEASVGDKKHRGFLFGSSLTPLRFTGDFDGDGAEETAAVAISGWYAPRLRVLEPTLDKKKKHAAVINIPSDIRGELVRARFLKDRKPAVFELAYCLKGKICTYAYVQYSARKGRLGRLRKLYQVEGADTGTGWSDPSRSVIRRRRRFSLSYCDENCASLTRFSPSAGEVVEQFTMESEARGPEENAPCSVIGTLKAGKHRNRKIISCVVTQPGKGGPDERNPVRYVYRSASRWVRLPSMSTQAFAAELDEKARKKGIKVSADPSLVVKGLGSVETVYEDPRAQLRFGYHGTIEAELGPEHRIAFEHAMLGPVYMTNEVDPSRGPAFSGAFYVPQPEGSFLIIHERPKISTITWLNGRKGGSAKDYTSARVECGSPKLASNVVSDQVGPKDLEVIGVTAKGIPLYGLKDPEHPLGEELFKRAKGKSRADFERTVPAFFRRDSFGRLVRFTRTKLVPPDMCEPVVYFYPERTRRVRYTVDPTVRIFKAAPPARGNTFSVLARPDGRLACGLPYLFWEGQWGLFERPAGGFSVPRAQTRAFLKEHLAQLGLQGREIKDFIETWAPRLERAPFNTIRFYTPAQIEALVPISLSPTPDTLIRVMMDYRPTPSPEPVAPPAPMPVPKRAGFTVVEWGGVERERSNVLAQVPELGTALPALREDR